ncbi:MAG: sigma factor-like helix-turn-helix DNA-binding protein [Myxococcota bacterium]
MARVLQRHERVLVQRLREQGQTFKQIGETLGLTRSETFQLLEAGTTEGEKEALLELLEASE